jgi:hypothetical protein
MRRCACALGVLIAASGCGGETSSRATATSVDESAPARTAIDAAARRDATLARRVFVPGRGFTAVGAGFAANADRAARRSPVVVSQLEARADAPIRLAVDGDTAVSIELTPEDVQAVPGVLDRGRVVFSDVRASTDAVHVATENGVEVLHVLRDARAPHEFAWRAHRGGALVDVRDDGDGGLSLVDARGRERMFVPRPFAIDANGVRRDARLEWHADRLEVRLDVDGLAFPVVLDPYVGTARWRKMVVAPPARSAASMTELAGSLVLFGGQGTVVLGDTWKWDGQRWTQLSPAASPSPRAGVAFASLGNRAIAFGGVDATLTKALTETWAFDGTTWTQLAPAHHPPGRVYGVLANAGGKLVLMGGKPPTATTWTFDGTDWSESTATAPSFDPTAHDEVFGSDGSVAFYVGQGQTWTFDGNAWTDRTATAATPTSAILLGRVAGKTVLLDRTGATYAWSGTTWMQLAAKVSLPPSSRGAGLFATANFDDAIAIFGGVSLAGSLDGFYRFDASGFSAPQNQAVPSGRGLASLASFGDVVVLFGGYDGQLLGDTWELDAKSWTLKTPATSPTPRAQAAFADGGDVAMLFGGITATDVTTETWTWDHSTWTQKQPPTKQTPDTDPRLARVGTSDVLLAGRQAYRWTGSDWSLVQGVVPQRIGTVVTGEDWSVFTSWSGQGLLVVPELGTQWSFGDSGFQSVSAPGIEALGGKGVTTPLLGDAAVDLGSRVVLLGHRFGASDTQSWSWDGKTWAELASEGLPPIARASAARLGSQVVLFGGFDPGSGPSSDTYSLEVALANGVACAADADCDSGHCAQGVCCNAACSGAAESCALPTTMGTCAPILAACVGASTLQAADGTTTSCAPYLCVAGACLQACATSADCVGGSSCDDVAHACTALAAAPSSSGGCALEGGDAREGALASVVTSALALLGAVVRRRRVRSSRR